MNIYQGVPVYPGVAIGKLSIVMGDRVGAQKLETIDASQVEAELQRLDLAFKGASATLRDNRDAATRQLGEDFGRLFDAYLLMINDEGLRKRIRAMVTTELCNVEYAVDRTLNEYANRLRGLDPHYAERANDVLDLKDRLLHELLSIRVGGVNESAERAIVAASFLKPNDAANLDADKALAIVTENGAIGSHTAIVASAMRIPTVLGVGPFLAKANESTIAIVDGDQGKLILDPTQDVLDQYRKKQELAEQTHTRLFELYHDKPATTKDGQQIELKGNIEFPYEADFLEEVGASGVGLYRTEFLFMTNPNGGLPDEETHFNTYKNVALKSNGKQITIRTFDLGADKVPNGLRFTPEDEENPFLGLRSIRLSLRNGDMFRTQLRAILRASVYGKFAVMFPLVSTVMEFRKARMIFNDVRDELVERKIPFDPKIPLGVMVETPAAVMTLSLFARDVDFFSIGSNDLLQYTMACDRTNPAVSELYTQEAPALLRMIKHTVEVAKVYGKPVSICGQMGSVLENLPLLLGLGLRTISVAPGRVLPLKEVCSYYTMAECAELAQRALQMESAAEVRMLLRSDWRDRTNTGY